MAQSEQKRNEAYQQYVNTKVPHKKTAGEYVRAFVIGGLICMLGQGIGDVSMSLWSLDKQAAGTVTAIVLVFLAAFLTGLGVFDEIGKFAGAGSFVPITGFSNAIVSAAMEYRQEGLVLGVSAKMFTIAGPVLVYGIGASVVVGLIACLIHCLM